MPFLVILKRFEVWLLLAVVAALFLFAFRSEPGLLLDPLPIGEAQAAAITTGASPERAATAPLTPTETFTVEEIKVTPSQGGLIVALTLSGHAPSGKDLTLDESSLTVTTDEGEPVNRFFEPFRKPDLLLASGDSRVTLKWWLERPTAVLWLDLQGERVKAILP